VSLRGDTNVLILIDGKPATRLQGSKAGDNLQSISAQDIERIEVLTTPPAQFKAEGTAGVINIITRKNRGKGAASGSLQASVSDGGRAIVGAGGTYGSKRLTGSANVGYRQDYRQRTVQSVLVGPSPTTGEMLMSSDHISEHANRNI
jgi:outer membrane cobalamin receptor